MNGIPSPDKLWKLWQEDPERAWELFLKKYHTLILSVTQKMARDSDVRMELYTHALTKLNEEQGKRLTSYFAKSRAYNFETWVALVVRKCCLDWFRHEKGRKRTLKCIADLSPVQQQIFQYVYLDRHSYETAYRLLTTNHEYQLSSEEMATHLDEIAETLQKHARTDVFGSRRATLRHLRMDEKELERKVSQDTANPLDSASTPEEEFACNDAQKALQEVLASLSPEQQLLIELHYYRDLTLQEIARALNMKNLWRVRWQLQKALKLLRKKLHEKGVGPADLENL